MSSNKSLFAPEQSSFFLMLSHSAIKEAHKNQKKRNFRLTNGNAALKCRYEPITVKHEKSCVTQTMIWFSFAFSCSLSIVFKVIWFSLFSGEIKDGELHIGQTTVPVYNPENKTKVPDVLFYENHQVRAWDWLYFVFLGVSLWLSGTVS